MKTLLVTTEYPPFKGGVANYYGNLAHYWPIGESLSVLDNSRSELLAPAEGYRFWPVWLRAVGAIRRKLKSAGIDYLLVGQILPLGTAALLATLFLPVRYGVFLHGLDLNSAIRSPRKKLISSLILRRADQVICANSYVAQLAVRAFSSLEPEKVVTVNPGVAPGAPFVRPEALTNLRQEYRLEGKTVLLTIGRLVRRKGVDQTISALGKLPKEILDGLVYIVAGAGPEERYLRQLVPAELRDKVLFLGEIGETEKWLWLEACDIFIMPARHIAGDFEGFGIVYLEANICSKPVIAGRSGGVSDAVEDHYSGLLVDPDDADSIAAAIRTLILDPEARARLGSQGRERAISSFNWEKQAASLLSIIRD